MDDYTNIERLAEVQRLEQEIREAEQHVRELKGDGSPNGKMSAREMPATVTLMNGSEIAPIAIRWIWKGWLAEGKLEILAGAVATGKTTIAIDLAATLTSGRKWPDGTKAEIGDALIWSGEDDPEDTLLPRFLAAGGVRERIHFVKGVLVNGNKRPFDPSTDMTVLLAAARTIPDLKLVIVDPVVLMVAGDSHKNTEVRRSLQPLADLAIAIPCVAVGITHLTKGTAGRDPIERVTGSLAFAAGPRLVLIAAKPLDAEQKRRLVRVKSNIGPDGDGFEYSLVQEPLVGWEGLSGQRVLWGDPLTGTARELLNDIELLKDEVAATPRRSSAARFLLTLLAQGPVPVAKVREEADAAGHSWRTMQRAQGELGVVSVKDGFSVGWSWRLPADVPPGGETDI
jgi:putative DNA primase/helicase